MVFVRARSRVRQSWLLLLLVACPLALVGQVREQDPEELIEEEIQVFESRTTIDFGSLRYRQTRRIRPSSLVVIEDGAPKQVTSLRPLSGVGEWRTVVYVDAPLVKAQTLRIASLALGEYIAVLTDLGSVEVVIADPQPRQLLAPSRQSRILEEALARLAKGELELDQFRSLRRAYRSRLDEHGLEPEVASRRMHDEIALLRRQADHLLDFASRGGDGRPSLLFLISDGYFEDPALFYFDEAPSRPKGRAAEHISLEVAQILAAYEWIVVPLPLRQDSEELPEAALSATDFDIFNQGAGGIRLLPKAGDSAVDLSLDSLEVSISPVLQPLRRLAQSTAGRIVRLDTDFEEELLGLTELWRAHYLTSRPFDGILRTTAARFVRGVGRASLPFARGQQRIITPAWVRSSTPAAVTEARLRRLLDVGGTLGLVSFEAAVVSTGEESRALEVSVQWGSLGELIPEEKVRLSIARDGTPHPPEIQHEVLAGGEASEGVWIYRIDLDPEDESETIAVLLEALRPAVWGGQVLADVRKP